TGSGIQLGLRAKYRNDYPVVALRGTIPSDGAGTYTFPVFGGPRGPFNYEFSINSDVVAGLSPLSACDFYLAVDNDPSGCVSYTAVKPLFHWVDNSYGNDATANGMGVEPTNLLPDLTAVNTAYLGYPTTYSIAQGSQNITFGDYPGGGFVQPGPADATYNYELYAVASGDGPNGARLASVGITVVVGSGGAGPSLLTCTGFQPPMDKVVSVKKKSNRVLPFKVQILDSDGVLQTPADIAAPVIQITFDSGTGPTELTDEFLSSGKGDEGNQFSYESTSQTWQFNLNSKQFTAAGTYFVEAVSGESCAYTLVGCEGVFTIQ
ncbi:MAG TPA: hypothetical protein VMM36_15100, partial [Opitutaceae bacterium]|nr:hypothetical protein [Opitutaceae bacterium]